jgi:hypothetical protein
MSGIRTFAGNRYAAGGKAGMNRGGGGAKVNQPMTRGAVGSHAYRPVGDGNKVATPPPRTPPANMPGAGQTANDKMMRGPKGQPAQGMRNPAQRVDRLQNRLEKRGNKIRDLKNEIGALKKQPPSPPVNMPGANQSQSNAIGAVNQGVDGVQGGPGQFMFGEDGPMTQQNGNAMRPTGRATFDNPNSPDYRGDMYGQYNLANRMYPIQGMMGGYGQGMSYGSEMPGQLQNMMGGYGQDMSYGSEMPVDYPSMMSGGGQGMYGQMSGVAGAMGGMFGQQGGYDQQMGQQQSNQQPPRQQQDPNYVPRYIGSSQAVDEARRARFGAVPGDKGYVNRMVQYYKGQGFPVPGELLQHWKGEQSRAQGLMGTTPQNKKTGQKQTRPAARPGARPGARPAARPGVKPTNPRGKVTSGAAKGAAKGGAKAGGKKAGGKRFAAGGVVPRPATAARPGMKGGGLARKGVGMALKGGGLARKGVGMALKSGGMVRGAGCAQRGRGKAK